MTAISKPSNAVHIKTSKLFVNLEEFGRLFHVSFCLYFSRVLVSRLLLESVIESEAQTYGGPFRYLTICVFTFQILQLAVVNIADSTPHGLRLEFKRFADDMSCATFVLANVVTVLYYSIEALIPGGLTSASSEESSEASPFWIDISLHLVNSIAAWTDIIISNPRRFSVRSFHFIGLFSFGYTTWISIINYKTGAYPYGFLNTMPDPLGLVLMVPIAATTMSVFFLIGKRLSKLTKNIGDFEQVEALDQFTPTDVKAP